MATINSLGIGSGVLTSELVDKIVSAERQASDLRLNTKKAEVNAKLTAISSVRTAFDKLQNATSALKNPSGFDTTTANVSKTSVATVSTSSGAEVGTHTLEVRSLAATQTLTSKAFESLASEVGSGSLQIRFGTTTLGNAGEYSSFTPNPDHPGGTIVISAANNTVAGVRDAINSAGLGIKARVVDDGSGLRLALSPAQAGAGNSLEISVGGGSSPGLSALAFNATAHAANQNLTQAIAASDAVAVIDGVEVRRNTNSVAGAVDGLTFNLTETNPGAPTTVTVNRNITAVSTRIQAFVDAYNSLKSLSDSLTRYDVKQKTGGLLIGDASLRTLFTQVRRTLTSVVTELPSTGARSLSEIGLSTDQTGGYKLTFDSAKFTTALTANPDALKGLFSSTAKASDNLIEVLAAGGSSRSGTYDVKVARLATQASLVGDSVAGLAGPIVIDGTNDSIRVTVDGVSSDEIVLAQGSYADGAALATALQERINSDTALRSGSATITVGYDATEKRLTLQSTRYGTTSSVGVDSVDTSTTATLGLRVREASRNKGLNVVGSINGVPALGASQVLTLTGLAPLASPGRYVGTKTEFAPFVIPAGASFTVNVDGIESNTVALDVGTYESGTALAAHIESKINADLALKGAEKGVSVDFDEGGRAFRFVSNSIGTSSSVGFVTVPPVTAQLLGVQVGAGLQGHPGGNTSDAAGGAQLKVVGGAAGNRGSLTIVRGVMHELDRLFSGVLGSFGTLANRADALNGQLDAINKESARVDVRIAATEARLRTQFAAADKAISQLNSTSTFLTQQLSALTNSNNN